MVAFASILFVTLFRIIPHPANFAPMGAVAIVSGRVLSMPMAIMVTCAAMVVSDVFLSQLYGYPLFGFVSLFVYGAFVLQALLGRALRRRAGGSLIAAFVGACLFFVVSNFGVWLQGGLYPRTMEGLLQCYVMAIPFFKMTWLGNMIWTPILSILHRLYKTRLNPRSVLIPAV